MYSNLRLGGTDLANATAPQIAASGSSVYVAWNEEPTRYAPPGAKKIYFNRSLDGGSTWLAGGKLRLDTDRGIKEAGRPLLAASGSSVYVAWQDTARDGYFNRSLDGGQNWLPSDKKLNTDPTGTSGRWDLQLAASGSSVYVTWLDSRNRSHTGQVDIYFNRSTDGGDTWLTSDVRLNTDPAGTAERSGPLLAASGSSVYVTWLDSRNSAQAGTADIYFNIPFGSQPYGEAAVGSGGFSPRLEGDDSLLLGSEFTLTVSDGLGAALGVMAMGGPGSKTSIPLAGGMLYVNPIRQLRPLLLDGIAGVPGAGTTTTSYNIPLLPEFIGFNANFQAAFLDPAATIGLSLSNAVEAWIL
ncbi:MAG: hypothetical protein ACYTG5_02185 [Planctomycetota bacterium]